MVILYNYLEEGTIKIGVFCCQAPRRGLRIEIAATQISVFRLCVKLRVGACGLKSGKQGDYYGIFSTYYRAGR